MTHVTHIPEYTFITINALALPRNNTPKAMRSSSKHLHASASHCFYQEMQIFATIRAPPTAALTCVSHHVVTESFCLGVLWHIHLRLWWSGTSCKLIWMRCRQSSTQPFDPRALPASMSLIRRRLCVCHCSWNSIAPTQSPPEEFPFNAWEELIYKSKPVLLPCWRVSAYTLERTMRHGWHEGICSPHWILQRRNSQLMDFPEI